jgi:hypothetical protein
MVKRLFRPLLGLVQPLAAAPRDLRDPKAADLVLPRHLAWRRSVLIVVLLLTMITAAIDTVTRQVSGPRPSFTDLLNLRSAFEPVQQTLFGDIGDALWTISFYAMPASALLAAVYWSRPRASRVMLEAGWIAAFLVPVAIALTPWSWWTIEPPPPATRAGQLVRQYERIAEGVAWGYYYVVVLSPAVLALVPGVMRACIRIKMLLPEATLPGWFLIAAAPFNGLLVLVIFVALAQVAPSPLLLVGMVLWLAAPFVYLARAGLYIHPIASVEELRRARRVQAVAWVLTLASAACLLTYVATWEAFGLRLVGFEPKTSLLRPWEIVRYALDFSGRALFVTVLAADVALQATLSVWRQQRAFMNTPAAAAHDRLMEQLEKATGN